MLEKSGGLVFVDVNLILNPTFDPVEHKVTFAYSGKTGIVGVLGVIPHGSALVLNQKLIDDLQEVLNIMEGENND